MAEADCWCIQVHACNKETCEMITILRVSKRDRSEMRYWYFVDFRHSILVFANFSHGIAVLGTLQCPSPQTRKNRV